MAFSARPTSTDLLTKLVNQTAHGFFVGQVLIFNGTIYVTAKADTPAHSNGCMIVSIVPDANSFYLTQTGWVNDLTGSYTPGIQYYLSPTSAGALTSTIPTTVGQMIIPCFVADTTTSGFFYGGSGTEVESGSLFGWSTATSNTNMGVNQGYFTLSATTLNMTLPPSGNVAVGDVIKIANLAGNFSILTNSSQTINFGDEIALTSITSKSVGDSIELICYTASPYALFQVLSVVGNLTYL